MAEAATYLLVVAFFISFVSAYRDWSGFERRVYRDKFFDNKQARKTGIRVGIASAVMGLTVSLAGIAARSSSPLNDTEQVGAFLYLAYIVSCTGGAMILAILAFVLKALALKSIYSKKSPQ
jgi:Na+/proline symporter